MRDIGLESRFSGDHGSRITRHASRITLHQLSLAPPPPKSPPPPNPPKSPPPESPPPPPKPPQPFESPRSRLSPKAPKRIGQMIQSAPIPRRRWPPFPPPP